MKPFIQQGDQGLEAARLALDFMERKAYKVHNAVFPLEKVKLKALVQTFLMDFAPV